MGPVKFVIFKKFEPTKKSVQENVLETVLLAFLCLGMVFVVISENRNRKYFPYVKQASALLFLVFTTL